MSYTQVYMQATCTLPPDTDLDNFVTNIVDYLGNHEEELEAIPGIEGELAEDVHRVFKSYLSLTGNELTIKCEDSEVNSDSDLAEFLVNHIAFYQVSPFMRVTWVIIDSREGLSINTYALDQGGSLVK
jgi:hypothetical protein